MNYKNIYDDIINRGKCRTRVDGVSYEIHHITPRCLGGCDENSNLSILTTNEHFLAHKLLIKIHPTSHKLIYAFNRMSNSGKYKSGSCYKNAREIHKKLVSDWSKWFMHDKVLARNVGTGKCEIILREQFTNNPKYVGPNTGKKYTCTQNIGKSVYINKVGDILKLQTDDPKVRSGEYKGINSRNDLTYLTNAARDKLLSTPWYAKPNTNKDIIYLVFNLYTWYTTVYNDNKPKATGIAKFYNHYQLPKSKTLKKLFKEIINGYNPNNDKGLIKYAKENDLI